MRVKPSALLPERDSETAEPGEPVPAPDVEPLLIEASHPSRPASPPPASLQGLSPAFPAAHPAFPSIAAMAHRRFHRPQAQEQSPATIAWLNNDLLAQCFAPLSQEDRLSRAALVCRRWYVVSIKPELQRKIVFKGTAGHSLLCWLQRHGPAIRHFDISLWNSTLTDAQKGVSVSIMDCWLVLCSGVLEKLSIRLGDPRINLTLGKWALTASHLQELKIDGARSLHTPHTLCGMKALLRLLVDTWQWQFAEGVHLPTSLTRLCISHHRAGAMPSQVAGLTNLLSLTLDMVSYRAASMASLRRLTSLRHADFVGCELPECLWRMTGLEELRISEPSGQPAAVTAGWPGLNRAFWQLTQLTGLWLKGHPTVIGVPASLAALSRLQWLSLRHRGTLPPEASAAETVLPRGPWQRSLRHLATSYPLAGSNILFLIGAERLQRISFSLPPALLHEAQEQWPAFWHWAAQHETLERIDLNAGGQVVGTLKRAVLQLQAQPPALHIDEWTTIDTISKELLAEWS